MSSGDTSFGLLMPWGSSPFVSSILGRTLFLFLEGWEQCLRLRDS